MKPWPVRQEHHEHMKKRQEQNRARCVDSKAEKWMAEKLKETGRKWTRQAQWGFRLFDFWNRDIGVAVEVDGKEHDVALDIERDKLDFLRSAIVVIRVRNFDEEDASAAITHILSQGTWNERRARMGLGPIRNAD